MQAIQLSMLEVPRPHHMQQQGQSKEDERRLQPQQPSHEQQLCVPAVSSWRGANVTPPQQDDDDDVDDESVDEELQIALRLSMSDAGRQ